MKTLKLSQSDWFTAGILDCNKQVRIGMGNESATFSPNEIRRLRNHLTECLKHLPRHKPSKASKP